MIRQAAITRRPNKTQISMVASLPAPIGGWNARDVLGQMAPDDAVSLQNWFPATTDIWLRYGHTRWATGFPAQVETTLVYESGTVSKLFGISSGGIYDATSGGAVGAASVSALTNSRWQYVNFATTGGQYLIAVNGLDAARQFDGAAWHKDGDGAPYDITGVSSLTLDNVNVFKNRLWFVQKNTLKMWYLPINALGGAAVSLDLSSVFMNGGYLMAMGTWTIDGGYGVDDYAVFVTSQGEVAVYRLTDPTTPTGIAQIGIFQVSSPIGKRCFTKYMGDMLIICHDGLYPLSSGLQSSRLNPKVALTDKIQFAMNQAVTSYGENFGWELLIYPKQNMLFMNVPVSEGSGQQQYVMNTITKAWCNFTGWEANCWSLWNDDPYFGGNTYIGKAWDTLADNGENIDAIGLQAFNYFKSPGKKKQAMQMRPTLLTNGSPALFAGVNVDFDLSDSTAALSFLPTTYATWDSGVWDTAVWGGGLTPSRNWIGANGLGYALAPMLKASSMGIEVQWVATDVMMQTGGPM